MDVDQPSPNTQDTQSIGQYILILVIAQQKKKRNSSGSPVSKI